MGTVTDLAPGYSGIPFDFRGRPDIEHNAEVALDLLLGDEFTHGVVDKMRSDPAIAGVTNAITATLLSAPVTIEPASEDNVDQGVAAAVRYALFAAQDHERKRRHDLLSMLYGFQPFSYGMRVVEHAPDVSRSPLIIDTFRPLRPGSIYEWGRRTDGVFDTMTQHDRDGRIMLDLADCQIVTHGEEWGQPMGRSMYRDVYGCFRNKLKVIIYAHVRLNRLGGVAIALAKNDASKKNLQKLLENMTMQGKPHLVLSEEQLLGDLNDSFRLEAPGGSTSSEHLQWVEYWDNQAQTATLSQFLGLGQGGGGSLALGQVQQETFYRSLDHVSNEIASCYNNDSETTTGEGWVRRFVTKNFGENVAAPTYAIGDVRPDDVSRLATIAGLLSQIETLPDYDQRRIRQQLDAHTEEFEEDLRAREKLGAPKPLGDVDNDASCCGHIELSDDPLAFRPSRPLIQGEEVINLSEMSQKMDTLGKRAADAAFRVFAASIEAVSELAAKAGTPIEKRSIRIPDEIRYAVFEDSEFVAVAKAAREYGRATVMREVTATHEFAKEYPPLVGKGTVAGETARLQADVIWNDIEEQVRGLALSTASGSVETAVAEALSLRSQKSWQRLSDYTVTTSINGGRDEQAADMRSQIEEGVYSAVLDRNTCDVCGSADGQTFSDISNVPSHLRVPNDRCLGTSARCRCIHFFRMKS